jgi:hypothetical protein
MAKLNAPSVSPSIPGRMAARTFSIEEANRISENYESQGFQTRIVEHKQGQMKIYEVWIFMEKDGFFAKEIKTD